MRVLMIQSNLVLANRWIKHLKKCLVNVQWQIASNPMQAKHYLGQGGFDLVLADLGAMLASSMVLQCLKDYQTSLVIVFSSIDRLEITQAIVNGSGYIRVVPCPVSVFELGNTTHELLQTCASPGG
jgi:hypothetical protein